MKFLAIEKSGSKIDWSYYKELLHSEALELYAYQKEGLLREIYFDENKHAVLVMECESRRQAEELLASLPIVKERLVSFDLRSLLPYSGFDRLICERK